MKTITVPHGLTEEEIIEFVREEIRRLGGNPDTAYPMNVPDVDEQGYFNITFKYNFDKGKEDEKES